MTVHAEENWGEHCHSGDVMISVALIEEYFEDVTGVYREEIAGLAEAGCT